VAQRHQSLIALSHDHHHGLALAVRLRQGDTALLNDGWTHDRTKQAKRVQRFYEESLQAHFKAEEEALFPAMRRHVGGSSSLIDALVDQHRELEDLIAEIEIAGGTTLSESLVALGELLERHIRSEERELFPLFESGMAPDIAQRVGEEIGRVHTEARVSVKAAIHTSHELVINAKTEDIYEALLDLGKYVRWWPAEVKIHTLGDGRRAEVGVLVEIVVWGLSVTYKVEELQEGKSMELCAVDGEYVGSVRWTIDDAKGGILVRVEVNLDPHHIEMKQRYEHADVASFYSTALQGALRGLERVVVRSAAR
jgi:iron-sulfur cluster repair protein YtfE (RIC family)